MEGAVLFGAILAAALWAAYRPEWCAPFFAAFVYLRLSDALRSEFGLPSLFMVLAPALLLLAFGRWFWVGSRVGTGWRPAALGMAAYGALCAGSLLYAANPERTGEALMNYLDGVFIVLVLTLSLRTMRDFERTMHALLFGGLVLGTLAVYQQLSGSYDATFAGLSRTELRNVYDSTSGFRSEGPVSANYFALVLLLAVPLAVDALLHERTRGVRAFGAATLLATVGGIFFTYSRGGAVALAVAALPMAVWVPRHRRRQAAMAGLIGGVVLVAALAPTNYGARLAALGEVAGVLRGEAPQDSALRGRISEVTSAALMFADHPFFGVGYGNFEDHYHRYARSLALDGRREERQAHSLYLEVAAETGLVGMFAFAGLLLLPISGVLRGRARLLREGRTREAQGVTAFGIALFGYLVGSLFLHLSYPRYLWLLVGIGVGLGALCRSEVGVAAAARSGDPEPTEPPEPEGLPA